MSPDPDRTPNRTVRVLLVEDAMDHALLVMTFLRGEGHFEVTHAQDGDRAIALLGQRDFDILVTDLNLPGTDGFDIIRHVREEGVDVEVLAVTAYTDPQYQEEALRAGASDVLHKPLMKDEVLERVYRLLPAEIMGRQKGQAVLAVGARPGDVEVGCGGALARHVEGGAEVVIVVLDRRLGEGGTDASEAARQGAEHLGARIVFADAAVGPGGGPGQLQLFVGRVADELGPRVAYVPAPGDPDVERAVAGRLAAAALQKVPLVLGYPTSTTRDFEPGHFTDVGAQMAHKAESLAYYQALGLRRKDLTAEYIQSRAVEAGREAGVDEAEAFVVVSRGS